MVGHGEHGEHGEKAVLDCPDEPITTVLDAAFEVPRELGPGLLESVYEQALALNGMDFERQVDVTAYYKGRNLGLGFRADFVVSARLLVELKAVAEFSPSHLAPTMTYMRSLCIRRGPFLNFNRRLLKEGINVLHSDFGSRGARCARRGQRN